MVFPAGSLESRSLHVVLELLECFRIDAEEVEQPYGEERHVLCVARRFGRCADYFEGGKLIYWSRRCGLAICIGPAYVRMPVLKALIMTNVVLLLGNGHFAACCWCCSNGCPRMVVLGVGRKRVSR